MSKTRMTRKIRRNKMLGGEGEMNTDDCKYPSTFHGLHQWHNAMFEKLGWMVLAKQRGMDDKIASYKNGVSRLIEAIDCKIKKVTESDRKDDLLILLNNVNVLKAHADSDFP